MDRKFTKAFVCSGASDGFFEQYQDLTCDNLGHWKKSFGFCLLQSFRSTNTAVGLECLKALSINHKRNTGSLERCRECKQGD